jgi:hypothetical protein
MITTLVALRIDAQDAGGHDDPGQLVVAASPAMNL